MLVATVDASIRTLPGDPQPGDPRPEERDPALLRAVSACRCRPGHLHHPRHRDSRRSPLERSCRARLAERRLSSLLKETTELLEDLAADPALPGNAYASLDHEPSDLDEPNGSARARDHSTSGLLDAELRLIEGAERIKGGVDAGALEALARMQATAEADVAARAAVLGRRPESVPVSARDAVVMEVSTATGLSQADVAARLDLATGPRRRTAFLRQEVEAGGVPLARACQVLSETANLSDEAVDEIARIALAPTRDGAGLTHTLFRQRLRRAVLSVQPQAAASRRGRCRNGAYARVFDDGTATLTITNDAAKIVAAMERAEQVARSARRDGDDRSLDQLRADFLTDAAIFGWPESGGSFGRIGRQPAATVWVVVPARTALGLEATPCELPGHGWVSASHARSIMTAPGSTWRRLLVDDDTGRAIRLAHDAYAPTDEMVRHVQAVDGTCRGPGCHIPATRCDLDHEIPWPAGPTALGNLTAKHRQHHNLKTAGLWKSSRGPDDQVVWRTFAGRRYRTLPKDWLEATRRPAPSASDTAPPEPPDRQVPSDPNAPPPF